MAATELQVAPPSSRPDGSDRPTRRDLRIARTRSAASTPDWSLGPRSDDETRTARSALPRRSVLAAVARRGLPGVLEASLVPSFIFVVVTATMGATIAMIAVLVWGYSNILRRAIRGRAVPSVLVLAMIGLTIKTLVGIASGSTFAYFVQPVATTVAVAAVFLGSVVIGRPLIGRIAHDFCPITPEVASRPAVVRLFAGLTILWAVVQLCNAGATLGMLVSMPTTLFVVLKPAASLALSATAVTITVCWALRIAHSEELVFAKV
jgi:uncharacterized protein DUF3159